VARAFDGADLQLAGDSAEEEATEAAVITSV